MTEILLGLDPVSRDEPHAGSDFQAYLSDYLALVGHTRRLMQANRPTLDELLDGADDGPLSAPSATDEFNGLAPSLWRMTTPTAWLSQVRAAEGVVDGDDIQALALEALAAGALDDALFLALVQARMSSGQTH